MKTLFLASFLLLTAHCSLLTAAAQAPVMKTEDQLRIRNLQFDQDKKLLEMKRLEAQYRELLLAVDRAQQQIENAVRDGARSAGVDLDKFQFDLDTLRFVPRPARSPSTKPPEVPK